MWNLFIFEKVINGIVSFLNVTTLQQLAVQHSPIDSSSFLSHFSTNFFISASIGSDKTQHINLNPHVTQVKVSITVESTE